MPEYIRRKEAGAVRELSAENRRKYARFDNMPDGVLAAFLAADAQARPDKQMSAADVRQTILHTAQADKAKYGNVRIRLPKDPGQAGKEQAQSYIKFLAGFNVVAVAESGSKEARAEPMAAQWQAGNFDIVYGDWNEQFLFQLENFPESKFKDMVDAASNGFSELENTEPFNVASLI